jgi:hypothetical protein
MTKLTLYGNIEASRSWWVAWMCGELDLPFRNERTEAFVDPALKGHEYRSINPISFNQGWRLHIVGVHGDQLVFGKEIWPRAPLP